MGNDKIILPNEYTDPADLVNLGVECRDCSSRDVIYYIDVPAPSFPCGPYCYKCLRAACGRSSRFPMPMETELLDRLQRDLGLTKPGKVLYVVPEIPYQIGSN